VLFLWAKRWKLQLPVNLPAVAKAEKSDFPGFVIDIIKESKITNANPPNAGQGTSLRSATCPWPVTVGRYIAVGKHPVSHGKYWPIKGLYCSRNPGQARGIFRCEWG